MLGTIFFTPSEFSELLAYDKIIIVIIINAVPSHCAIPSCSCNHNTDNKAADKGSADDNMLDSVGFIYFKLSKKQVKAISVPNMTTNIIASTEATDHLPLQSHGC